MTDHTDAIRAKRREAKNLQKDAAEKQSRAALLRREANKLERAEKRAAEKAGARGDG